VPAAEQPALPLTLYLPWLPPAFQKVRKPRHRAVRATSAVTREGVAAGAAPGQLAFAEEFGYLADALAQARRALATAAARQGRARPKARRAGTECVGLLPHLQGRAVLDWSDVAEAEREEDAALGMGGADRAVGAQGAQPFFCVTSRAALHGCPSTFVMMRHVARVSWVNCILIGCSARLVSHAPVRNAVNSAAQSMMIGVAMTAVGATVGVTLRTASQALAARIKDPARCRQLWRRQQAAAWVQAAGCMAVAAATSPVAATRATLLA
jgi:hypothetical protein